MTKMFAVVGHPIKHSLSPLMHNRVFKELKLDCEYQAVDVLPEELESKVQGFKRNFHGINVTIPHKVNVIRHLDFLSEDARLIGAVNTIKFDEGKGFGYNTDGIGCIRALEEAGVALKGERVLVLGAGGASRAISFQLAKNKSEVYVADKITKKAFDLAGDVKKNVGGKIGAISLDEKDKLEKAVKDADLIINATPIGMSPNASETPIDTKMLRKEIVVMDIVYNPVETKFLREAKKTGCKTVDGVGMFVHQGAEALKIWLGIQPPVDLMRDAVLKALNDRIRP